LKNAVDVFHSAGLEVFISVGGMPIMVPQYGDSNSLLYGGVWWGGNLKGMLYSLVE